MLGTRIVLSASAWRLAFRVSCIRSRCDVARLSTPKARILATSFPIGMEARTPPLAETPDPSLGVENPAQQEEKEKPDHTHDEDTQKKKKLRIKKKKLKSNAYQPRSMDLGLAEMPFSKVDVCAAFEIPKPHSQKAKTKRKTKDHSENDNEDASKKIKRVNYFVSLPITNSKILDDIQTFQDAVVQKEGRLSRAMCQKGSFHIALFVMRLDNEDEVNLAISALLECKIPVEKVLQEKELVFSFHGVGDFKNEVVYGKMTEDVCKASLKEIAEIMEKIFKEKGVHTEGKKGFIPHLTFMKMSRAPKLRKQGLKKINPSFYKDFQDHCFGKETLFRLDLCSMLKQRQECGYYHTEASIFFGSKILAMSGTYKQKSGAVKRKLSLQGREDEASTSKIDTFFGKKSEIPKEDAPGEITDEPMELVAEEVIRDPETESSIEICLPNKEDTLEPLPAKMPFGPERTPLTEDYFHYGQDLHKAGITMEMFWDFHPNQPTDNTPFNDKVVYYRNGIQGSNVHRRWVTFNEKTTSVHCSICLFYGLEKYKQTPLIQGCSDWRHITATLMEHENSQCHTQAIDTYFLNMKGKSIKHKLSSQMTLSNQQVLQCRAIVSHIIDILFFICVQAVPYRSSPVESVVETFEDHLENRGTILETVKLLADYSPVLKEHLTNVIQKAKTCDPSNKEIGKFETFLSKSTIDKLFSIIGDMLKEEIVKEVESSGLFSIQMNSTQDVSAHDQCAIVVRYVAGDKVKERLLRLVTVEDSSSKNLHALLKESLSETGLDLEKCIADSFDGVANLSGTYTGLQALMKEVRPTHVHTWCYAHVLNLVIADASTVCVPAVSLFGLLGNLSTFFNESYKRMKLWDAHMRGKTGSSKLKKLERIGKTRWSSRDRALQQIFGSFDDHSNELCSDLVLILKEISESTDFRTSVRHEALKLSVNLCKFETILAAFTFIRVFDITTPVSDYLQTTGLDFIQAWRMVDDAVLRLDKICRDFAAVFQSASTFIDNMNEKLAGDNIHLNKSFLELRSTRSADGTDNRKNFEISCYNVILDTVLESVKSRFLTHGELYKQISCLDPKRFDEILASSDQIQLNVLSDAVTEIDPVALREELLSFAFSYKNIRKGLLVESDEEESEAWDSDLEEQATSSSSEPSTSTPAIKKDSCKNCVSCAFKLLHQYRLCSVAFENLFLAYKYLLTLSTTPCTCERSFSKLKILKSRLRSSPSQQNLEPMMLIAVEKQVAVNLKSDKDKIIDRFAKTSPELSSLLLL